MPGIRGIFHEYALPTSQFVPGNIAVGPDGNLWFTEIMQNTNGSGGVSKIGRMTPTGTLSEFSMLSAGTLASDIIPGPDGNLWFTEGDKIARITPQGKISEFKLTPPIYAQSIATGPDGNLWFTEYQYSATGASGGKIGSITTAGKISDFSLPTSSYVPTSIMFRTDHTLWFIEVEITVSDPFGKNGKIGHLV